MSLIIHFKIPGAIVAASDCRITGKEQLYIPIKSQEANENGKTVLNLGNVRELLPQKGASDVQIPFGYYDFVKTDTEQKTFIMVNNENRPFVISYCGNANLNGYPTSYQIKRAMKRMLDVKSTSDIAKCFELFWNENGITQKPALLISGYNQDKASVLEPRNDGQLFEHFQDDAQFGIAFHGKKEIVSALIKTGDIDYSLFRLQDAIEFCKTLIESTAKIQSFQRQQQTVSEQCDIAVINENSAKWVHRTTMEM